MRNEDIHNATKRKQRMVERFMELKGELSKLTRNDLFLLRTSELEELGKELAKCVEHARQLRSEK